MTCSLGASQRCNLNVFRHGQSLKWYSPVPSAVSAVCRQRLGQISLRQFPKGKCFTKSVASPSFCMYRSQECNKQIRTPFPPNLHRLRKKNLIFFSPLRRPEKRKQCLIRQTAQYGKSRPSLRQRFGVWFEESLIKTLDPCFSRTCTRYHDSVPY